MANKINYQRQLDDLTAQWQTEGRVPTVLLHSCCAPCSSYCLEYLSKYCEITVFYFNPNITDENEYRYRLSEQKRLIEEMPFVHPVSLIEGKYDPDSFLRMARGLEEAPERGPRCYKCYRLRLEETAHIAAEHGFEYFATTLTLSPLKPADVINDIGLELAKENTGTIYLPTDFKKKGGYLRSIELSQEYGLYRQNYCGCIFSKRPNGK